MRVVTLKGTDRVPKVLTPHIVAMEYSELTGLYTFYFDDGCEGSPVVKKIEPSGGTGGCAASLSAVI